MSSLEELFEVEEEIASKGWGSDVEVEIRNRIKLAIYAYAYEIECVSLVSDAEFDRLAKEIRPKMNTGNKTLDRFFATRYSPDTGMWIHTHPGRLMISALYARYYCNPIGG